MTHHSPLIWISGFIAAFLAMSATAGPPVFSDHNRIYGNSVGAGKCDPLPNGYRCRHLHAWENYDVKGEYQYTEVVISFDFRRDFSDGSWVAGNRHLVCPVDQEAISVLPNHVSLAVTLDPAAPGCYSGGERTTFDPIIGIPQTTPWGYSDPREVVGEWLDPMNYSNSISNRRERFHDGWSDTSGTAVRNCKESFGDLMQDGGFSTGPQFHPFEGSEGPAWSFFQTMTCNENNMQR
jgi:hypothetical protein